MWTIGQFGQIVNLNSLDDHQFCDSKEAGGEKEDKDATDDDEHDEEFYREHEDGNYVFLKCWHCEVQCYTEKEVREHLWKPHKMNVNVRCRSGEI